MDFLLQASRGLSMGCIAKRVSLTNTKTVTALIRIGGRDGGLEITQRIINLVLSQPIKHVDDTLEYLQIQSELDAAIRMTHSLGMSTDLSWLDQLRCKMWRIENMLLRHANDSIRGDRRYGIHQLAKALQLNCRSWTSWSSMVQRRLGIL